MTEKAKKTEGLSSAIPQSEGGGEVSKYLGLVRVNVRLTGITPLMPNAMSMQKLREIGDGVKRPKTAAKATVREQADSKVYLLPDGRPHWPVKNLYSAFIAAGCFVRMDGKRQWSNAKSTNLPGALTVEDVHLPIYVPNEKGSPAWEVDIQQGRNPNGGEAVCIVRPRFDAWELRLTLEVDQQQMPLKVAEELVTIAGRRIGIGDFRPARKGTFGRFSITLWEPIPLKAAA